jgi:hypothetical protein
MNQSEVDFDHQQLRIIQDPEKFRIVHANSTSSSDARNTACKQAE